MANFPTALDNLTNAFSATDTLGLTSGGVGIAPALVNISNAINNLETKVGIDNSAVTTTIDYLVKNAASIDPGHHHTNTTLDSLASSKVTGLPTFPAGTIVGTTDTQNLTNKRRTRRVVTVAQSAAPAINTDNTDVASITGLAQAITSMTTGLTGTPVAGDLLEIQITDNGIARAITWGASFGSTTVLLPTTTVISTILRIGLEWNATASLWQCIVVV